MELSMSLMVLKKSYAGCLCKGRKRKGHLILLD